jgi:hypothetical protein
VIDTSAPRAIRFPISPEGVLLAAFTTPLRPISGVGSEPDRTGQSSQTNAEKARRLVKVAAACTVKRISDQDNMLLKCPPDRLGQAKPPNATNFCGGAVLEFE